MQEKTTNRGGNTMKEMKLAYSRKGAALELTVSPRTIDYWIEKGHLKARKLGRRVLIPGAELVRILKDGIKHRGQHDTR